MKVPNKINTLLKLCRWTIKNKPKVIEIKKGTVIHSVATGNLILNWDSYRGIKIKWI